MDLRVIYLSKGNLQSDDRWLCPIYEGPNVIAKDTQTKPVISYRPPCNGKYKKNLSRSSATITTVPTEPLEW
jgi:hypothetical protein